MACKQADNGDVATSKALDAKEFQDSRELEGPSSGGGQRLGACEACPKQT